MKRSAAHRFRPAIIAVVLTVTLLSPPARPVRQQLVNLTQPVGRLLHSLGVATSPIRSPSASDQGLTDELQAAQAKLGQLEIENAALRQIAHVPAASAPVTTGAEVIGRSTETLTRTIRINRGAADNVSTEAAVLVDGWLIGKVKQVDQTSAEVQLVTDPDFRLTVTVGHSQVAGLARGSLGALTVERLPLTEKISVGDHVLSSDVGGQVTGGLPLGKVSRVSQRDNVFYQIDVDVPIELETIRFVQVVVS